MKAKIFILVAMGLSLAACCGNGPCGSSYRKNLNDMYVLQANANVAKAEQQLAEAATSINYSLQELASMQKAVYPAAKLPDLPDANRIGMGRFASIDWTGPVEPLVRNVAAVTNYKVRVLGKNPAIPIIVSITARNQPVAVILRNAAYQAGNRANIVVYPNSRVIELRYARV
jgi:defect-in-organelle-trafficking protein DotD